jgi:ketosteroid isomerase-like protein
MLGTSNRLHDKEENLMNEHENVELVKQGFAAFQRGDIETVLNFFSDDIDFRDSMPAEIWPWAGKRRGRAQAAEFYAGLAEVAEFEQFEPQEFIAQGNKVVVLAFERFRIKATGRMVENELVTVLTLREGKVVQLRTYEDTAPIIAASRGQGAI